MSIHSDTKAKARRVRPHGLENEPILRSFNNLIYEGSCISGHFGLAHCSFFSMPRRGAFKQINVLLDVA
jgi:hypothetical protein